jgi:hypothetical protein
MGKGKTMQRSTNLAWVALSLVLGCTACEEEQNEPTHVLETVIRGRAPFNCSGEVSAYREGSSEPLVSTQTDYTGRFEAKLGIEQGDFIVEASGGTFEDPVSGHTVHADGAKLRAVVLGASVDEASVVVVSPWTEMAVAASSSTQKGTYGRVLAEMTQMLTCGDTGLQGLLTADPAVPTREKPTESLDASALAFLYNGAWSQLASELSIEAGVQPGARITALTLVTLLASDIAEGQISGSKLGKPLRLANDFALPPNILRQRFAQAALHFLESPANKTSVRSAALLDLLRCVSLNGNATFGAKGEPLDTEGPQLTLALPADGAVLAGDHSVVCRAHDVSGLVHFRLDVERDTARIGALVLSGPEPLITGQTGEIKAQMSTHAVADGEAQVVCTAEDRWGNQSSAVAKVVINNHGGNASVSVSPQQDGAVSGSVTITCFCEDPQLEKCVLNASAPEVSGVSLVSEQPNQTVYHWDTTASLDGPRVLVCEDWSRGLGPISRSMEVTVDNVEPGHAEGWVALDGPVRNVRVSAYAYRDAKRGRRLGTVDSEDGSFAMTLADSYRGPVLFEAVASPNIGSVASYRSAVIPDDIALNDGRLTLLWDHYEPGERISPLSINLLSSLAEAHATSLFKVHPAWLEDTTLAGASEQSHRLWGQYLRPRDPVDVRRVPVHPMATDARPQQEEAVLMGLFHVGVSRLAIEYGLEESNMPYALTATKLLDFLRQDLVDTQLDGLGVGLSGAPIKLYMTRYQAMRGEFLRYELASAIRRWLDKEPISSNLRGFNATSFLSEHFSHPGQLLRVISSNGGEIFGSAGREFDLEGPQVAISVENLSRSVLDVNIPVGGEIYILAEASDESGVQSTRAYHNGEPLPANGSQRFERPESVVFVLDTRKIADGPIEIVVQSKDRIGNLATSTIQLTVLNTPPELKLNPMPRYLKPDTPLHIEGTAGGGQVNLLEVHGGTEPVKVPVGQDGSFKVDYPVPCDTISALQVHAWDVAGNETVSENVEVICDNHPPEVTLETSVFRQHFHGRRGDYQPDGTYTIADAPDRTGPGVLFDLKTWGEEEVLLEVYGNRLDYLPEESRGDDLPVLKFRVGDHASGIGTPNEALRVEYRYDFDGLTHLERGWESLPAQSDGSFVLPFSYQTLLSPDLQESIREGKASNFILLCSQADHHTVTLKVTDLAGNSTERPFKFKLAIGWPPVVVADCDFHPAVHALSLAQQNIQVPFIAPAYPALTARVYWALEKSPNSLMSSISLPIALEGGQVSTTAAGRMYTRRYIGDRQVDFQQKGVFTNAYHPLYIERDLTWDGSDIREPLKVGEKTEKEEWTPEGLLAPHTMSVALEPINSPGPSQTGPGKFLLEGQGGVYEATFTMHEPHVDLSGGRYTPRVERHDDTWELVLSKKEGTESHTMHGAFRNPWGDIDHGVVYHHTHRVEDRVLVTGLALKREAISASIAPSVPIPLIVNPSCSTPREHVFQ